nr:hypothetical protein [Bacteroides acidifaciens]
MGKENLIARTIYLEYKEELVSFVMETATLELMLQDMSIYGMEIVLLEKDMMIDVNQLLFGIYK